MNEFGGDFYALIVLGAVVLLILWIFVPVAVFSISGNIKKLLAETKRLADLMEKASKSK